MPSKISDIEIPTSERRIYPAADCCIYCGKTIYAPGPRKKRGEEHIIPFGLNGELIIPEASCRSCERVTGRDDGITLKGSLLGCRTILRLKTREPSERPKELPLFTPDNRKVMVKIEDYPALLLLMVFDPPQIIHGGRPQNGIGYFKRDFVDDPARTARILRLNYGVTDYAYPMLNSFVFSRMLAKIAHSYAVAEQAFGNFTRILPDIIRDKTADAMPFVGGDSTANHATTALHEISMEPVEDGAQFLVCRIRLLAFLGTPTYRVVVGGR